MKAERDRTGVISGAGEVSHGSHVPRSPSLRFRMMVISGFCLSAVAEIALRDYEASLAEKSSALEKSVEFKEVVILRNFLDSSAKLKDSEFLDALLCMYDKRQAEKSVGVATLLILRSILLRELKDLVPDCAWIKSADFMVNAARRADQIALLRKRMGGVEATPELLSSLKTGCR